MITDSNHVVPFAENIIFNVSGGDMLLLAMLIFLGLTIVLIMARAKASTSMIVGISVLFLFGFLTNMVMPVIWIAMLVSIILLVNGIRKRYMSQI